MGWTFTQNAKRADVIAELTAETNADGREYRTLRKCFRGNTMYALHESRISGALKKWIAVYLLQRDQGFGWGYKSMSEDMGPCYYDCPLFYLDQADAPMGATAAEWRAKVRLQAAMKPKVGQTWRLMKGCVVDRVRITSLRPLRGEAKGSVYKLQRGLLVAEIVTVKEACSGMLKEKGWK